MKKHKMTKRLILALGIIGLSVTGVRADSVNEKEITYADPTIYVENQNRTRLDVWRKAG